VSLDPSRQWLAAGITGLARHREWDAVVTTVAPGEVGDEVEFVVLEAGRLLVERATGVVDAARLAESLVDVLEPPYRALGVRRPELWVIGSVAIEVVDLSDDLRGDEIEVVTDDAGTRVRVDGLPSLDSAPALERIGAARSPAYVVRAQRLVESLFEIEVEPL
jgi:hypothetical protein